MSRTMGEEERRARKAHVCFLCSVPVEKGSTYLTWAWLDPNGEIARIKAHPGCNTYAIDALRDEWCYGDGLDPGAVEADAHHADHDYPDEMRCIVTDPSGQRWDVTVSVETVAAFHGKAKERA